MKFRNLERAVIIKKYDIIPFDLTSFEVSFLKVSCPDQDEENTNTLLRSITDGNPFPASAEGVIDQRETVRMWPEDDKNCYKKIKQYRELLKQCKDKIPTTLKEAITYCDVKFPSVAESSQYKGRIREIYVEFLLMDVVQPREHSI